MSLHSKLKEKRAEILQIAAKYGASNIRVFGSVARGDEKEESDIDMLITLEKGRSLLDHAALVVELEDLLGCKVDVATETGLRERVRRRILQEAVPL